MRDPELMQRADRAAIALEEAWERWRGMHGLGTEPLPPVSSYVGYSLEEPWGQPRVVFGLRADEAELLASLLDGHDCVGPIYTEVSARPGWRRQANGPASQLNRPYANSVNVPEQAPPSPLDQIGQVRREPDDDPDEDTDDPDGDGAIDGLADLVSDTGEVIGSDDAGRTEKASRAATEPDDDGSTEPDDESPSLAPLPEPTSLRRSEEKAGGSGQAKSPSAKRTTGRASAPSGGPGYRGPRYQGFPPRYDSTGVVKAAEPVLDADDGDPDVEPVAPRRSHVAKLNRGTRRRATGS